MQYPLVDFHCHLDLYQDYKSVYEMYRGRPVELLSVTTTPRAWAKNIELAAGAPNIRVGLGLHPQLVHEEQEALTLFQNLLPKSKYVGEVGLDASPRFYKHFALQKTIFEAVLRACSEQGGKILSIHSVRCAGEMLRMLEAFLPQSKGTAVLHWFTGSASEANLAVQLGCYFSVNTQMLKSEQRRQVITSLPRERILTETDGPFILSAGKPSLPNDVNTAVDLLASLLNLEIGVVKSLIYSNLRRLESGVTTGN